jgi:hypothetical protein
MHVCEHGSIKSMIAATLFNRLAEQRGLAARAVSRGTIPDSVIPQRVRDGLRDDGTDLGDIRPTGFSSTEALGASLLVVFDVQLPSSGGRVPVRRWDGTPSVMTSYSAGREAIALRVTKLVSELESTPALPRNSQRRGILMFKRRSHTLDLR